MFCNTLSDTYVCNKNRGWWMLMRRTEEILPSSDYNMFSGVGNYEAFPIAINLPGLHTLYAFPFCAMQQQYNYCSICHRGEGGGAECFKSQYLHFILI